MSETRQFLNVILVFYTFLIISVNCLSYKDPIDKMERSLSKRTTKGTRVTDHTTRIDVAERSGGASVGVEATPKAGRLILENTGVQSYSDEESSVEETTDAEDGDKGMRDEEQDGVEEDGEKETTQEEHSDEETTEDQDSDEETTEDEYNDEETTEDEDNDEETTEDEDNDEDTTEKEEYGKNESTTVDEDGGEGTTKDANATTTEDEKEEDEVSTESFIQDMVTLDFNHSNTWLEKAATAKVRGILAYEGQFPFIALITNMKRTFFVGTILSRRWVVTSSYNFVGEPHKPFNRTKEFMDNGTVFVGGKAFNLRKGFPKQPRQEESQKIRAIFLQDEKSHRHSKSYLGRNFDTILYTALVQTHHPFHFDKFVRPVRLGGGGFPSTAVCVIAGYVEMRYPQTKWVLRWKRVQMNNAHTCMTRYHVALGRGTLCSIGPRGRLGCDEDVGSPVLCGGKLVAIVTIRVGFNSIHGDVRNYAIGCGEPSFLLNLYATVGKDFDWLSDYIIDLVEPAPVNYTDVVEHFDSRRPRSEEFEDYRSVSVPTRPPLFARCSLLIAASSNIMQLSSPLRR